MRDLGVVGLAKVDFICLEGLRMPQGSLREMDRIGPATVLEELHKISREMPDSELTLPRIVAAMANEGQTFYKNNQANPWLLSYARRENADDRH